MIAPSSIRNHAMYALTRCSMYFSDASRPIGNSNAVIDDHEEADAVDADDVAHADARGSNGWFSTNWKPARRVELPEHVERRSRA